MQKTAEHSRQTHTVLQVLGAEESEDKFSWRRGGGKFLLSLWSSAMASSCPFYLASLMKSSIAFQVCLFVCF